MNRSKLPLALVAAVFVWIPELSAQVADELATPPSGNPSLLWLGVITLVLGLGFGIWQVRKVRNAKRNNEHSTLTQAGAREKARERRD